MSHTTLRRVVIRLLHDPAFVTATYAEPDRAFAGMALTDAERGWLLAQPRAAWSTDPERPKRVLRALLDEFPATTTLVPDRPAGFFQSAAFHRAVQERGSLAAAFAEHLGDGGDALVAGSARIEAAIARVRRAPRPRPRPDGRLRCTPWAAVVAVAAGGVDAYAAVREGRTPEPLGAGTDAVLVLRSDAAGVVGVEDISDALAGLLEAARTPQEHATLCAVARTLGAEAGEDADVVDDLVRDRLLL